MNRNLLAFSILMIISGAVSGTYIVSILGFFLLFPAILTSPRPRPSRVPASVGPPPKRIIPKPVSPTESQAASAPTQSAIPSSSAPSRQTQPAYSLALFPTTMFPSFSQPLTSSQQPKETTEQPTPQKDELLEVGALLTILRLALG